MDAPASRPQLDLRRLLLLWGVTVPLVALSASVVVLGWLAFIGFSPGCDGTSCPEARSTPIVFASLALSCVVVWGVATAAILACVSSAPARIGWLRVVVLAFPAAAAPFVCIYVGLSAGSLAVIPAAYLLWMALWAAAVRAVVQGAADLTV